DNFVYSYSAISGDSVAAFDGIISIYKKINISW
ncbi:unnamed protein product, partial [marine sediment metagenome]